MCEVGSRPALPAGERSGGETPPASALSPPVLPPGEKGREMGKGCREAHSALQCHRWQIGEIHPFQGLRFFAAQATSGAAAGVGAGTAGGNFCAVKSFTRKQFAGCFWDQSAERD
ncbi:UNVERIFIED_CONTAM: hypothetical protein K2H54_018726 [Gekko kuhli]